MWYNKHSRQDTKMRIHKALIRPKINSYSLQTRSETISTRQQAELSDMKVTRRVVEKTRRSRKRK